MELGRSSTDEADRKRSSARGWAFPALLAVVVLIVGLVGTRDWQGHSAPTTDPSRGGPGLAAAWTPSAPAQGETVSLEIDFGNGAQKRFAALPWQPEMTVAGLLQEARQFRPGIQFRQRGEGAGGFLTGLDGLPNEGAGGKNWKFEVDGEHGRTSFCLQTLLPGAHVLWKFASDE